MFLQLVKYFPVAPKTTEKMHILIGGQAEAIRYKAEVQ